MLYSIAAAAVLSLALQQTSIAELFYIAWHGYSAQNTAASILNGGGIISMLKVMAIVGISSAYAVIFQKTGLLKNFMLPLNAISKRINSFFALLITAVSTSAIACNQTLAIMLSHQLAQEIEPERQKFALDLENSVVVLAPIIPWSIASGVPLTSVGAPTSSIVAACFLYLLPLCTLLKYSLTKIKHK